MKSEDMAPSIRDGDLIIYYRVDKNYRTGDETAKEVIRIMQNNCSRNCNHTLVLDTEKFCISGGISA